MGDKSPKQNLTKKVGKSLKEKRAEKHLKAQAKGKNPIIAPEKHR